MNTLFCGIDFHKNSCTLCYLDENGKKIGLTTKKRVIHGARSVMRHLDNNKKVVDSNKQ